MHRDRVLVGKDEASPGNCARACGLVFDGSTDTTELHSYSADRYADVGVANSKLMGNAARLRGRFKGVALQTLEHLHEHCGSSNGERESRSNTRDDRF